MKPPNALHQPRGFSLSEMLVVIAVIGIVTAIALPAISQIHQKAGSVSAKRNAQQAAAMSATIEAAGIDHVASELDGGIEVTLTRISNGINVSTDVTAPNILSLPLSAFEIEKATEYLTLEQTGSGRSLLIYRKEGGGGN